MTPHRPTRRRFLTIAASALALGCNTLRDRAAAAADVRWRGIAFGADVSITLRDADADAAAATLEAVRGEIARMEALFNLFDPGSALSRLNAEGTLDADATFRTLLDAAIALHGVTEGLFDPTVQPLWRALSTGGDVEAARALIGVRRIERIDSRIRIAPGMALTFNGIAQGFASDAIADLLRARGYQQALVNIGEYAALGAPWRLGIANPEGILLDEIALGDSCIATSSAGAMLIGRYGQSHILGPGGESAAHATVSVVANRATLADALSTALILAEETQARRIFASSGAQEARFYDAAGRRTLRLVRPA